jgi:hypothetical protein
MAIKRRQLHIEFRIAERGDLSLKGSHRLLIYGPIKLKKEVGVQLRNLVGDAVQILLPGRR